MAPVTRKPFNLDQFRVPRGRVSVISERCKGCSLCIDYCPTQVLELSIDYNFKGYRYPVLAETEEKHCVSCRFCEEVCPDFAIFVTENEESK